MSDLSVAIVIPTFKEEHAEDTVFNLKKQTYSNLEIIVAAYPNLNISEARNKGLKKTDADIVGFTDDDCYPHEDWVEEAVKHFNNPKVGGVEGCTYGGMKRWHDWGYMGANIFYRKEIIEELNGFDVELAGYMEDTDFAWRLIKHDYKIVYEPEAKVHHPKPAGSEKIYSHLFKMFKRHPLMFTKNYLIKRTLTGIKNIPEVIDRKLKHGKA